MVILFLIFIKIKLIHFPELFTEFPGDNNLERLDEIGHGSYGVVYKAMDKTTNEIFAIKYFDSKSNVLVNN